MEINKQNQILLNKLVEISSGKYSSVVPAPKRIRQMSKQSASMARQFSSSNIGAVKGPLRGISEGPRSLNYAVRKSENERIERENHKFAQRLFNNQGIISMKVIEEKHKLHEKYKKNILKVKRPHHNYLESLQEMESQRLPPLVGSHSSSQITQRQSATERPKAASEQVDKNPTRPKLQS